MPRTVCCGARCRHRYDRDPAAVKAYFVGAFEALPKATVKFGNQLIRVYGNTAVNTGYYTFSYTKDGETKSIPARYSFTYVKDGNDWKIVDHHSPRPACHLPNPIERQCLLATIVLGRRQL